MLVLPLALAGCATPRPAPYPHFVLGDAYQAGGVWYYPHESFNAEQTGLASIETGAHAALTTDGEIFDQTALAAAHQTLQLPAIARVTNLENGRQVVVRINQRGPASPARLIAVTRRTAELLGFADAGVARVRLQVLDAESHAVADPLRGAAGPTLAIAAAPRGEVTEMALAPPAGAVQASQVRVVPGSPEPTSIDGSRRDLPTVPARLPETVTQTVPHPGSLYVQMGTFSRREFAERQRARAPGVNAAIERERIGRSETYRVQAGPFATVAEADAALNTVIRAGISDARIVVE
ncbi:MAG: septal ring lytic transglycosylase RlpA family protein [Alphaproteobacteria bacterium]|nr:septal ring lytic transglycosylase RlpA family protein [Alphaproteobacteria bacterium]